MLSFLFSLKHKIYRYKAQGNKKLEAEIKGEINNFIGYFLEHKPFIFIKITSNIDNIRKELQDCFEKFTLRDSEYQTSKAL